MSEKQTSDEISLEQIRNQMLPKAKTSAIQADAVDVETKQITSDVPLVPRLLPDSLAKAQVETGEGLNQNYNAPLIHGMSDQFESVSAYPDPTAGQAGREVSIQEFMLETTRDKQGIRERFYQDRARDSAVTGFGDDQLPQPMYSRDFSQERLAAPTSEQANIDVAGSPAAPSMPPQKNTMNLMYEQMRGVLMNLQNQFAVTAEALAKGFDAAQKRITSQKFLTPSEEDELP